MAARGASVTPTAFSASKENSANASASASATSATTAATRSVGFGSPPPSRRSLPAVWRRQLAIPHRDRAWRCRKTAAATGSHSDHTAPRGWHRGAANEPFPQFGRRFFGRTSCAAAELRAPCRTKNHRSQTAGSLARPLAACAKASSSRLRATAGWSFSCSTARRPLADTRPRDRSFSTNWASWASPPSMASRQGSRESFGVGSIFPTGRASASLGCQVTEISTGKIANIAVVGEYRTR